MSSKRSYPGPQGYNKSRVINGKVLKYKATAPLSGSFRSRQMVPVGELKNVDTILSGGSVTGPTATVLGPLNVIAQGPGQNERIGRRVTMKSLWVRWQITMNASLGVGASPFHLLIVYDKQNNAGLTGITSVLTSNSITAFKDLSNERRFVTLMDEWITPIGTGGPQSVCGQRFIKMNQVIEFNTSAAAAATAITTGLVTAFIFQTGLITGSGPEYQFQSRVRYSD